LDSIAKLGVLEIREYLVDLVERDPKKETVLAMRHIIVQTVKIGWNTKLSVCFILLASGLHRDRISPAFDQLSMSGRPFADSCPFIGLHLVVTFVRTIKSQKIKASTAGEMTRNRTHQANQKFDYEGVYVQDLSRGSQLDADFHKNRPGLHRAFQWNF
jgi:hypothetical protein